MVELNDGKCIGKLSQQSGTFQMSESRFYQQIGREPGVLELKRAEDQKTHIACRLRIQFYYGFARGLFGIYILGSL